MDRTFAPNYTVIDGKRIYQDRDKANGISGTSLVAEDRTKVEEELIGGIIEKAGLTPDRADLSQVNKALSIMYAAYERGIAPYSADVAKRIGGYPLNAVVCDPSAQGVFWRSAVPKNTGVPGAENSGWVLFFDGYATQDWVSTALSQGLATKQPTLGFVPVQQGGGANQGTNKVFLGWATDGSGLTCQVDDTDIGKLAGESRPNSFQKPQYFNDTIIQPNGNSGVSATRYVDANGTALTNIVRTSDWTQLSWFGLYQDGMLRTNLGDVAFVRRDIDYGPINGGYYSRVGNVLIQCFTISANHNMTINLPIAMSNADYAIALTTVKDSVGQSSAHAVGYLKGSKTTTSFVFMKNWINGTNSGDESELQTVDVIVKGVL